MRAHNFTLCDIGMFDAPMLAVLHSQAYQEAPWSAEAITEVITMPGAYGIIAVTDPVDKGLQGSAPESPAEPPPEPVGFILARRAADECEILTLAVRPEDRGCGAGRALLRAVITRAQALAVKRIFLEVAEDNMAALSLYKQAGFSTVGRRPRYYRRDSGQHITAIILARDIQDLGERSPLP